jgi:hypothetical protein
MLPLMAACRPAHAGLGMRYLALLAALRRSIRALTPLLRRPRLGRACQGLTAYSRLESPTGLGTYRGC